jgi:predicted nucleic acid-binding protein
VKIVADTGPIIGLAKIGRISLLKKSDQVIAVARKIAEE